MIDTNLTAQTGTAVRSARIARGVTQDDPARLLGVDRVTVSRYEGGKRARSVPAHIHIASCLELPISRLLPDRHPIPIEIEPAPLSSRRLDAPCSTMEQEAIQSVVRSLEDRPDLIPTVLDLLEKLQGQPL